MKNELDPYKILNVSKNATKKEIKKRYFALAKIHHTDKGGDAEIFIQINTAYVVLMDDEKRKLYDECGLFMNETKEYTSEWILSKFAEMFQAWINNTLDIGSVRIQLYDHVMKVIEANEDQIEEVVDTINDRLSLADSLFGYVENEELTVFDSVLKETIHKLHIDKNEAKKTKYRISLLKEEVKKYKFKVMEEDKPTKIYSHEEEWTRMINSVFKQNVA